MKLFLKIAALVFSVMSMTYCTTRGEFELPQQQDCETSISEQDALRSFSIILSRAISKEKNLRAFLKTESLKEYDCDYDVFYPYVKDVQLEPGISFRQLLDKYTDSTNQLDMIEKVTPKLTILVPDFKWVDNQCFDVHTWDISSDMVAVSFDNKSREHEVFYDGECVGALADNSFPSFPIIIVKSNERMVVHHNTKSSLIEYSFADPAFNNAMNRTKVQTWEGDYPNITNTVSVKRDLVSDIGYRISKEDLMELCPEVISAYDEFNNGWDGGVQRDYLYYGMTRQSNNHGILDQYRRDMIYRLKINPSELYYCMDDIKDPSIEKGTRRDDRPEFDEVVTRMWANGNVELKFDFYQGIKTGSADLDEITLSIYPGDLMYIDKCHDVFQWNIFGNNWSVYSIKREEIQPKWFYPSDYGNVVYLHNAWNLFNYSQNVWFKVSEIDENTTYSVNKSESFKYNISASIEGGTNVVKGRLGGGYENGGSCSFNTTYTDGEDTLGSGFIEYTDDYISSKNADGSYMLDYATTYSLEFSLLPIDKRNKIKIRDYLLQRRTRNN